MQNVERFIYLVAKRIRLTHACTSAKTSIFTSVIIILLYSFIDFRDVFAKYFPYN